MSVACISTGITLVVEYYSATCTSHFLKPYADLADPVDPADLADPADPADG
jgi:hypothetical protein